MLIRPTTPAEARPRGQKRPLACPKARPMLEVLEDRLAPANLALFFDSAFVDTISPPPGDEANEILAALQSQGHTVTTFTGITDTDFRNALVDQDALVIPELELGDLGAALTPQAQAVIANFVSGGGGLIIAGQSGANDTSFLNTVFSFGLTDGSNTPGHQYAQRR
jgi:hypothetical protein